VQLLQVVFRLRFRLSMQVNKYQHQHLVHPNSEDKLHYQ
jgi:hypothetical protein